MLTIILTLILCTFIFVIGNHFYRKTDKDKNQTIAHSDCGLECGKPICALDCESYNPSKKIEYFDDEELDVFKERPSNQYTDEETEQFRDILYTMKEEEVPDWMQSLQMRNIELPDGLKDEAYMIISELNRKKGTNKNA
jgi:hypothetical protein